MAAPRSCAGRILSRCGRARTRMVGGSAVLRSPGPDGLRVDGTAGERRCHRQRAAGLRALRTGGVGGAAARRRRRLVAAGGGPLPPDADTRGRKRSGLPPLARLPDGHVAVVSRVLSDRRILATHANWVRHQVSEDVPVIDVSPGNDWTRVRVWWPPTNQMGVTEYATFGLSRRTARPSTTGFGQCAAAHQHRNQ